jgi:hypothetical protein
MSASHRQYSRLTASPSEIGGLRGDHLSSSIKGAGALRDLVAQALQLVVAIIEQSGNRRVRCQRDHVAGAGTGGVTVTVAVSTS